MVIWTEMDQVSMFLCVFKIRVGILEADEILDMVKEQDFR